MSIKTDTVPESSTRKPVLLTGAGPNEKLLAWTMQYEFSPATSGFTM